MKNTCLSLTLFTLLQASCVVAMPLLSGGRSTSVPTPGTLLLIGLGLVLLYVGRHIGKR